MTGHNMGAKDNESLHPSNWEKVRKVFHVHAEKCSVNGVSFIIGTKYKVVRICWTVLLILALIAMIIHLGLLLVQYFDFQKQSLTDLDFNVLPFPAITICNVNPVRISKAKLASRALSQLITNFDKRTRNAFINNGVDINDNGTDIPPAPHHDSPDDDFDEAMSNALVGNFDIDSFLNTGWDGHTTEEPTKNTTYSNGTQFPRSQDRRNTTKDETISTFNKLHSVFRILYSNEPPEMKKEMGHALQDMLLQCDFAGVTCKASDFKLITSNTYGNCYTFEHDGLVANDGPLSGINIILYLELGDYMKGFTPSKGIQVVVHDRNTIPFPEDEGFSVAASSHTMVGIKMNDISRLGSPYGECSNLDDFKEKFGVIYTRQTCQKICQAKSIIEACDCFDPSFLALAHLVNYTKNKRPCKSKTERSCVNSEQVKLSKEMDKNCFCRNPCKEKMYEKTISSRLWPDADYAKVFVNHICSNGLGFQKSCDVLQKKGPEELSKEFLFLSIYYEDLNYQLLKEVPNYKAVQLISDIGGTIGLWIGLSVLSVFEVVHLVTSLFLAVCCPGAKTNFKKSKSNALHSSDIAL